MHPIVIGVLALTPKLSVDAKKVVSDTYCGDLNDTKTKHRSVTAERDIPERCLVDKFNLATASLAHAVDLLQVRCDPSSLGWF